MTLASAAGVAQQRPTALPFDGLQGRRSGQASLRHSFFIAPLRQIDAVIG